MLKNFILNFHENLEGLRDFVTLIDPFLDDYNKKLTEKHGAAFKPLEIAKKKYFAEDEIEKKQYDDELKKIFDGEIEIIPIEKKLNSNLNDIEDDSDEKTESPIRYRLKGDTKAIDIAFDEFAKTKYHKELLYKNSLISLLSTVEWFFSQILHFHYDKFPEAAGIKNKTLTLEDLKSFNSVKDAQDFLIENRIEDILRASIKDWFKVLKDELKLGLGYKDIYENELIEIYQRRNLLVHNGGVINSIYLAKVPENQKGALKIGDVIEIEKKYLENAISKLELIFTLIACELWKKLGIEDLNDEKVEILSDFAYKYLKQGEWEISYCANFFIMGDKSTPIASRTVAQLNVWLCKKELEGYNSIKKEIEQADYSDKSLLFQVALSALKDDKEFFFNNINQLLKTEELSPANLFEFPIFREMRNSVEFDKLREENLIIKTFISVNSL